MDSSLCIGIDVSQDWLGLAAHPTGQPQCFKTTPAGLHSLVEHCRDAPAPPDRLRGLRRLRTPSLPRTHPRPTPLRHPQPPERPLLCPLHRRPAKTDRIDAAVIAQFAHDIRIQPKPAPSRPEQTVRDLATRRNQLVGDHTRVRHQARLFSGASLASAKRHLAFLKREIAAVEQELRRVIAQDVSLRERWERLRSVPGVGETLAAALLGSMPELGRLNRAAVGMLAGLAPHARDSGKREGKRFCWGGRANVRRALYMPMLSAVQHNPVIRTFYQRLLDQGKPRKVALVACMRKMLTILNAILREETTWGPTNRLTCYHSCLRHSPADCYIVHTRHASEGCIRSPPACITHRGGLRAPRTGRCPTAGGVCSHVRQAQLRVPKG